MMRAWLLSAILAVVLAGCIGSTAQATEATSLGGVLAAHDWLNGRVSPHDLEGKVVLVDFYTFNCINCKHTEPNLRALYQTTVRDDLVIVGIHTPETSYERDRANVIASLKDQGIRWPVAIDNDNAVWDTYGIQAWPTQLVFDRHGRLQLTVVGEGQDDMLDRTIRRLIAERS